MLIVFGVAECRWRSLSITGTRANVAIDMKRSGTVQSRAPSTERVQPERRLVARA
jgi:hypothetical protein